MWYLWLLKRPRVFSDLNYHSRISALTWNLILNLHLSEPKELQARLFHLKI